MAKNLIDPTNITKYDQTDAELELTILFWICAAGKGGIVSARCLAKLLDNGKGSPFQIIARMSNLAEKMKAAGIGCYNNKARSFLDLISKKLDLKKCTVEELESVIGIGPKTARCYIIHSRRNQRYAGLDTHLLKYLKDKGHDVPKSTPTGKKYRDLERIFLEYVDKSGKSVADFDLSIWNEYRVKK